MRVSATFPDMSLKFLYMQYSRNDKPMNAVVFPKNLELRDTKLNRKFLNLLGKNCQIACLGKGGQNRQLSGHVFKNFLHALQAKRRGGAHMNGVVIFPRTSTTKNKMSSIKHCKEYIRMTRDIKSSPPPAVVVAVLQHSDSKSDHQTPCC